MDKKTMVTAMLSPVQIAAGAELLARADAGDLNVTAAMWIQYEDQPEWRLLFAIRSPRNTGPRTIYTRLQFFLRKKPPIEGLALSNIVVEPAGSPLMNSFRMLVRTEPGVSGIKFEGNFLNGQRLPDAYVYRLLWLISADHTHALPVLKQAALEPFGTENGPGDMVNYYSIVAPQSVHELLEIAETHITDGEVQALHQVIAELSDYILRTTPRFNSIFIISGANPKPQDLRFFCSSISLCHEQYIKPRYYPLHAIFGVRQGIKRIGRIPRNWRSAAIPAPNFRHSRTSLISFD
jgi:hypothetical protein